MSRGSYEISFVDDGDKHVFPIFQDARSPLVPRLQLIEARELVDAGEITLEVEDDALVHVLPRSSLWRFPPESSGSPGSQQDTVLLARSFPESPIDENDILSAAARRSQNDEERYEVYVELTSGGAKRMTEATKRLLKKSESDEKLRLAIMVNGEAVMAPRLQSVLSNSLVISGQFTKAEAENLAVLLKPHSD